MVIYWFTQSSKDLPDSIEWLHPAEKEVLAGFNFAKKQKDWKLGRWTAKNAVRYFLRKSYPALILSNIEIRSAPDGAPEAYYQNQPLPVFISLSHSHGVGFCVLSLPGYKLGCDLEKIESRSEYFIRDYFTTKEQNVMQKTENKYIALLANLFWSAKESTLKALRTGLRIDTRNIEIDFVRGYQEECWYNLEASYLKQNQHFYGYWQIREAFVFTVLMDIKTFQLVEISL